MIAKTKAIVLKNTDYRESSVISKMYTREYGLRTYILQSIKKGKGAIRPSMIQPLSLVQLDAYEKPGASIHRLKELKNVPLLMNIQEDIKKKSIAMFVIEVLNQCISEELCEIEMFDFIESQILRLENEPFDVLFPLHFLLQFTAFLGVDPQGKFSEITPYFSLDQGIFVGELSLHCTSIQVSEMISNLKFKQESRILDPKIRRECLQELIRYYQYHITKNKKIKSVEILAELLH